MRILAWLLRRGNWPPRSDDETDKHSRRAAKLARVLERERRLADKVAELERAVLTNDPHPRH